MFYYVKGSVVHMAPYLAVVDCGGVGYACRTTNNTLARLRKGETATLYTHLNVREDAMELYGFASENELSCFQLLGKKIAQRIILELKDKLAKGQLSTPGGESYGGTGVTVIPQNKASEAAAALAVLGYSQAEAAAALKNIDMEALALEEIIKQALKKMVK